MLIEKKEAVQIIVKTVAQYYYLPEKRIHENTRKRPVILARQLCHYFACKFLKHTLSDDEIGFLIGRKNRGTVYNSCNSISDMRDTNKQVAEEIEELDKILCKKMQELKDRNLNSL
jgi:chromosomal replication initiation ATPase DnaA